jgi:5'-3' exonuclease
MTIAHIDADIVAFRCAAITKGLEEHLALHHVDELMKRIIAETEATEYVSYLTGDPKVDPSLKPNFRKIVNTEYKANRKDQELPEHLNTCKNFIVEYWNGYVCDGYEADDGMGIAQTKDRENSIICSIDKDLLMIPGRHYNFVKKEFYNVDDVSGIRHFYKQLIIGDTADNIFGVKGSGKVAANKILDSVDTEEEMFFKVYNMYQDQERFLMNADCLWIWKTFEEKFTDRKDINLETLIADCNEFNLHNNSD